MSDAAQRTAQRIHRSTGQRCRHLMRDVREELAALARWHEYRLTTRVPLDAEKAVRAFARIERAALLASANVIFGPIIGEL